MLPNDKYEPLCKTLFALGVTNKYEPLCKTLFCLGCDECPENAHGNVCSSQGPWNMDMSKCNLTYASFRNIDKPLKTMSRGSFSCTGP